MIDANSLLSESKKTVPLFVKLPLIFKEAPFEILIDSLASTVIFPDAIG